ncbi:glycosyltransferase family 2 protein [Pontibacter ruber]|uniref:Glycosyltransferase family 2 protein n=1 Tax=Pontibacter ruber TaxID=1343895 RepID=A0ABW5D095_9BACT|nr:glycosyltransferase family 2 protein [Pontibacter ruber]
MNFIQEGGYRLKGNKTRSGILVSIITVVYNGEKFLEHTINSVLAQTYPNIEYIVVDGGSSDGTLSILRKYDDQIAYWKSEPDKGISDAFNKGVALATGELVGILNADDWYEPDAVARIVSRYQPDSVLYGSLQYWNLDGSKDVQAAPNLHFLPFEMSLNHPTVFVSSSLYHKYGVFNLNFKLAMDYHLLLRFYKAGATFIYVDGVITNMRHGGASSNVIACYREVLQVKNDVLGNKITNQFYFYWQVLRRTAYVTLSRTPLSFINKLYRKHLSPIKRQY